MANVGRKVYDAGMDEGRKRVIAIIAGIIVARNPLHQRSLNLRATSLQIDNGLMNVSVTRYCVCIPVT
jgi:hypothetical protein